MENRVRESADFIAKNAKHVTMGTEEEFKDAAKIIESLVKNWKPESWSDFELHPSNLKDQEKKAAWIFLIDTMNYAFWTPPGKVPFTVKYNGKNWTGYWSMCAAIKKYADNDESILEPSFWAKSTIEDWQKVFVSETETPIPFIEWRQQTISEAGKWICEKYEGSIYKMLKSCNKSALALTELVRANLESYRDQCEFNGRLVYFLKRAQILPADLHYAFFDEKGEVADACTFTDINEITMFADYRVPQALYFFKLIHYDDYLFNLLKTNPHLEHGSELECEIRGCSIQAVEILKKYINYPNINSVLIDFVLWPYAKEHTEELKDIPIHMTSSVFY